MFQNFSALAILQGANYLLPLISYPFLLRTLEIERWGLVSFGYTFTQYLVIFTDFGFNSSATKYISSHRDNIELINRYLNSAFIGRILLGIVSFIILLVIISVFNKFNQDAEFYLLYFGIVIGNIMFPMWFFQGMEKMKYIAIFNILAKLISFTPFFIFIREPKDYILVPVFYSIGYVLAGIISIYFVYFREKMKWFIPTFSEIRFALSDSSTYFLSRLSLSFFTYSNSLLLGLVYGNVAVGYYSAAEKLYQAYNWALTPFTGVLFPYMANKKDVPFFKRVLKIIIPSNIIMLISILLSSYWIIQIIYGEPTVETLNVFRILIIGCFWTIPSMLMGYPFLAAMGYALYTNWTMVIVSIIHIVGLLFLFVSGLLSIYTVALMTILTELLLFAFRLRGVYKFKLFSVT